MKIRPTPGDARMLPNVSTRLLPRRSGISSVLSSSTPTKPGPSPRGLASALPLPSLDASTRNGERAMKSQQNLSRWCSTFFSASGLTCPKCVRRSSGVCTKVFPPAPLPSIANLPCRCWWIRFLDPAPAGDEQRQRLGDLLDRFDVDPLIEAMGAFHAGAEAECGHIVIEPVEARIGEAVKTRFLELAAEYLLIRRSEHRLAILSAGHFVSGRQEAGPNDLGRIVGEEW